MSRTLELSPIKNDPVIKDSIMTIEGLSYMSMSDNMRSTYHETQGGVRSVVPYITMPGILNRKQAMEGLIFKGVDEEYTWQNFEQYIKEGVIPYINADEPTRDILISVQTAQRMKLKVGEKVVVYFVQDEDQVKKAFTISGLYKTGLEEYDRKFAFLDMKVIQDVLGWRADQVSGLEIILDDVMDSEPIADYIYTEILPSDMYSETIKEKYRSMFDWIEMQDITGIMLLALMGIVALVNMSTALLIFILERSKMIGVLKALGYDNWSVRKIFVIVSLWILGWSIVIGNLLGIGLGMIQKHFGILKLNEADYYLSQVPISFDFIQIIGLNLLTILITTLLMIIPTLFVTRITPVKILRFK